MNLNELDFQDVGNWPAVAKIVALVVVFVAVIGAGVWFDTRHQYEAYERTVAREGDLKREFETKARRAANLDAYRAQLQEMEERFGEMLGQLPSRAEVAELLVDITQTGVAAGLGFELFRPGQETRHDFYAELPISVRVSGQYHELGDFIGGIAALSRIVTMHDVSLRAGGEGGSVVMDVTAKTYRYLDADEVASGGR